VGSNPTPSAPRPPLTSANANRSELAGLFPGSAGRPAGNIRGTSVHDPARSTRLATEGTAVVLDPAGPLFAAIGAGNLRAYVQGTDDVGHAALAS
jgi:hypothetical protein